MISVINGCFPWLGYVHFLFTVIAVSLLVRHCERSEAIQVVACAWIASLRSQ
ncbi:MAG: hypothetical protein LBJ47_11730 [Tannerella sp.]|nr:hypothetical protein [Tannerella sp.]